MSIPTETRQLDRLALVSRVLYDQRVLDLRRENEALRLQLFWKDHSRNHLAHLMIQANRAIPKCACSACGVSGRIEDGVAASFSPLCAFKPWFEARVAACGLNTYFVGLPASGAVASPGWGGKYKTTELYDGADAHFHHVDGRDDWGDSWTYGARLWRARDVGDAELLKLRRLFARLEREVEEAGDDGVGSSGDEVWM